jgi:hypothetical protein
MLINLLTGLPIIILYLVFQAIFIAMCMRTYLRLRLRHSSHSPGTPLQDITLLAMIMLLLLLGNFVQIALWAALFVVIGEFSDFATALCHSAVNFATLGYGDIVMSPHWRLLGSLEAANGILMFGVSTAVTTAAVGDVLKQHLQHIQSQQQP